MEQNTDTATESQGSRSAKELVRPLDGRVLAGVSQALANRYDVPLWVVRLLFVLLTFAEGLGIALYAAGWLLIRSEDEAEAPAQRFLGGASKPRAWVGIVLIFIAAAIFLDAVTFVSSGVLWAAGLLLVGVLLYTGYLEIPLKSSDGEQEGVQRMTPNGTRNTELETAEAIDDSPVDASGSPAPRPAPRHPRQKSTLGRFTVGLMLLGVGVLAVLDNIGAVPVDASPRHYMALAVTILGLGLIVGSIWGRARWLILLGAILVPTLLFSPLFEGNWNSEGLDIDAEPLVFSEIEDSYEIDAGNMVIDLRRLDWDGQTVDIVARVDIGNLVIRIPDDVGILGTASVDIGRVASNGRQSSGVGDPTLTFDEPGTLGTVRLDAHVNLGNIEIEH